MEFYAFIVQGVKGADGTPLFDFRNEPTPTPTAEGEGDKGQRVEGEDHAAGTTKVVDRRWYERNKHIYPASTWEEFDAEKDYANTVRRDQGGNAFFF